MKLGRMLLYYNCEKGFIFAAETKIAENGICTPMNPAVVDNANITPKILGGKIFESLMRSREAEPMPRSLLKDFRYWQISGIKSFSAFSKKYKCINITEENANLCITKLTRDNDGGYSYPGKEFGIKFSLAISKEELGKKIFELFTEETDSNNDDCMSFSSLNDTQISYTRPSDDFIDIGDGHTDAYQIFTYENNDKNYIAFMIDNGYSDFTESAIKERWQQMYGKLLGFSFQTVSNKAEKIQVRGKTKNEMIVSHIYQDEEDLLEVLYEVDLINTSEKEKAMLETEFEKVIASIKIG